MILIRLELSMHSQRGRWERSEDILRFLSALRLCVDLLEIIVYGDFHVWPQARKARRFASQISAISASGFRK